MNKSVVIGNDHRGISMKMFITNELKKLGYIVDNVGHDYDPHYDYTLDTIHTIDYNDYAKTACAKVLKLKIPAILICGSGIGMSIAANRVKKIRAAVCYSVDTVITAKKHNNINVLCLGADIVDQGLVMDIVMAFLQTDFLKEDRYIRRNNKLDKNINLKL